MHRLALVLLIMLTAVAFALAFFLSPDAAPGPIGYVVLEDVVQPLATTLAVPPALVLRLGAAAPRTGSSWRGSGSS